MDISVIIPTHNRAEVLRETLKRLLVQEGEFEWEVVVVNNNSADNTEVVVEEMKVEFRGRLILVSESKPGASAARNRGVNAAKGKYIVFIDNDVYVEPDFLKRHLERLEQYPDAWIVGHSENLPEQYATRFGQFRRAIDAPLSSKLVEIDLITGQTTSLPRKKFIELGGFDENFHIASGEDRELAIRAIKEGVRIYYDPEIKVKHNDWAGSTIRDYCLRQRMYTLTEPFFWKKYGSQTPRLKLVKQNLPPSLKRDGWKLIAWKNVKRLSGSRPGQAFIFFVCSILEKIFPKRVILWKLYRLAIAGAIYSGFNKGLRYFKINVKELSVTLD